MNQHEDHNRKTYIVTQAVAEDDTKIKTNKDLALFHYLNENGLLNQKLKLKQQIAALENQQIIPEGQAKNQVVLSNVEGKLRKAVDKQKVSLKELDSLLAGLEQDVEQLQQFVQQYTNQAS